eukprot:TRINITY_DN12564_c0_g1_i1.p1 TRINITY_DN12564_c0_g1~~TRINITY_DN12564_c0_g1_i1.p1  ORF type:complete len:110 (-),score=8.28 TRINITY_DN12564_c0_g1_i1:79-408(-)
MVCNSRQHFDCDEIRLNQQNRKGNLHFLQTLTHKLIVPALSWARRYTHKYTPNVAHLTRVCSIRARRFLLAVVVSILGRGAFNLSLIHISEPTRLLSISYAVFCLKKKK